MTARSTPTRRWSATLLTVPAGAGKTLVAGGTIKAGIFIWKVPNRPSVG